MRTTSLFFAALLVLLSSCRKDRTCACTVTKEGTMTTRNQTPARTVSINPLPPIQIEAPMDTTIVTPLDTTFTTVRSYKKVLLRTAKYNCISYETNLADTAVQSIPGTATITTIRAGMEYHSCQIE